MSPPCGGKTWWKDQVEELRWWKTHIVNLLMEPVKPSTEAIIGHNWAYLLQNSDDSSKDLVIYLLFNHSFISHSPTVCSVETNRLQSSDPELSTVRWGSWSWSTIMTWFFAPVAVCPMKWKVMQRSNQSMKECIDLFCCCAGVNTLYMWPQSAVDYMTYPW